MVNDRMFGVEALPPLERIRVFPVVGCHISLVALASPLVQATRSLAIFWKLVCAFCDLKI